MRCSILIIIFSLLYFRSVVCQNIHGDSLAQFNIEKFRDGIHHWDLFSPIRDYQRFDTTEIEAIAKNLIDWQNNDGGWPKNIDWLAKLNIDSIKVLLIDLQRESTFDNHNIFPQIEYLAKSYFFFHKEMYKESAEKGIQYILENQHINGGWRGSDVDAITFNDGVMTGVMGLFLDILSEQSYYKWISPDLKNKISCSYNKALSATLRCQIIVNGRKTAWCQQHSNNTFKPVKARSYELESITAKESSHIVLFLMKIDNPGDTVIDAIESAVIWLDRVKIKGFRYEKVKIPGVKYHETTVDFDRVFIPDSSAKPVWARYYNLETNKSFLCNRDGVVVYNLSEVDFERRVGYEWYGYWPEAVFARYPVWRKKVSSDSE